METAIVGNDFTPIARKAKKRASFSWQLFYLNAGAAFFGGMVTNFFIIEKTDKAHFFIALGWALVIATVTTTFFNNKNHNNGRLLE